MPADTSATASSPMPDGVGIIDTMCGFPTADRSKIYKFLTPQLRDRESLEDFEMPAQYMFGDRPPELADDEVDPLAVTLMNLDQYEVERAMVSANEERPWAIRGITEHADRFIPSVEIDPRAGMGALEKITRIHETYGARAVTTFPAGYETAINDRRYWPVYAKCCELGLPIFVCAGIPGPRVPMNTQKVEYFDEVCYDFPELTVVMRHGGQPWTELAVKLMLKWPGLHYSTSAFAPKHYDPHIIDYANSRGADKVIYAGYFPAGLTYERIMGDMPHVPFRSEEVWTKFLRTNALRVLGLD